MRYEEEIKKLLVSNAIHLIASGGFEKATTKELAFCGGNLPEVKMNEAYIYRFFGSKENLYDAAFRALDGELFRVFCRCIERIGGFEDGDRGKLNEFFSMTWRFMMANEEHCRCYVRYYYSAYFKEGSREAHRRLFGRMVSKMKPLFKDEADVEAILHSVFTAILDFAVRVYNGEIEDNGINRPHVFNVLYCMMESYLIEDNKNICIS